MTVVAIDGPAGAGKSSVARALAARLRFTYLDTGAMYRVVALAHARRGGAPGDVAHTIAIELLPGGAVVLDGEEVTSVIRSADVSEAASVVAADPAVRAAMVAEQRRLLGAGDWVAEGRDIGTVVWPAAAPKVYLTASAHARAQRRAAERGVGVEAVLAELAARDERDTGRAASPLRAADDAVTVDTTGMTLEQVVDAVAGLVVAAL